MLKKLDKEKRLLRKELARRLATGQLFGKPDGEYVPVGFEKVKAFQNGNGR